MTKQLLVIFLAAIALTGCKQSNGALVVREPDLIMEYAVDTDINWNFEIVIKQFRLYGEDDFTTVCEINETTGSNSTIVSAEGTVQRSCSVEYEGSTFTMNLDTKKWTYSFNGDPSYDALDFAGHDGDALAGDEITFAYHSPMVDFCVDLNGYPEDCDE